MVFLSGLRVRRRHQRGLLHHRLRSHASAVSPATRCAAPGKSQSRAGTALLPGTVDTMDTVRKSCQRRAYSVGYKRSGLHLGDRLLLPRYLAAQAVSQLLARTLPGASQPSFADAAATNSGNRLSEQLPVTFTGKNTRHAPDQRRAVAAQTPFPHPRRRRGTSNELLRRFALHRRQRPRIDTLGTGVTVEECPRLTDQRLIAAHTVECTTRLPSKQRFDMRQHGGAPAKPITLCCSQLVNHPRLDLRRVVFIFVIFIRFSSR